MIYKTFPPHPDLDAFVKCFWTMEAPKEKNPKRQRIVPDGCMEMIFHYGDLFRQYAGKKKSIVQPRCFVFGQITRPLEIEPSGATGIFAVRFNPEGFTPFRSIPVTKMENRAVPLKELFGAEADSLEKDVLIETRIEKKISIVEKFLLRKLASPEAIDRTIKSSVETIIRLRGQVSVSTLSEKLNVNRRQLERKFASLVGLSPKQLSKITRLQATLKVLASGELSSLTSAAHEGEYYDQAHFIKDFKKFTGMTPKAFYSDSLKMSSLFIDKGR